MHKYSAIDLVLTLLLLSVAILLEVYAVLLLLSSDWTDLWLSKHTNTSIRQAITCLQLPKHPRWSNSISQFNLLSFSLKDKHTVFYGIQKLLCIDKVLEKHLYTTREKVPENMRKFIFDHLKEKFERLKEMSNAIDLITLCGRGGPILEKYNCIGLDWSIKVEFEQSILIWHIATDLCYHSDDRETPKGIMSKWLSQYMLYLLVMCPFMLPMGIGMIRFRDTCAEVQAFFEEHKSISGSTRSYSNKSQAREMLLQVKTEVPPTKVKGDRSKSVLFDACRLASQLQGISDKDQKWEMVSSIWVEMLAYAASQCRGNYHAQQLRRGGELLTHVWLLMAHFGLTEQFQISQGHARAKLVVK